MIGSLSILALCLLTGGMSVSALAISNDHPQVERNNIVSSYLVDTNYGIKYSYNYYGSSYSYDVADYVFFDSEITYDFIDNAIEIDSDYRTPLIGTFAYSNNQFTFNHYLGDSDLGHTIDATAYDYVFMLWNLGNSEFAFLPFHKFHYVDLNNNTLSNDKFFSTLDEIYFSGNYEYSISVCNYLIEIDSIYVNNSFANFSNDIWYNFHFGEYISSASAHSLSPMNLYVFKLSNFTNFSIKYRSLGGFPSDDIYGYYNDGYTNGYSDGYSAGNSDGLATGYQNGYAEGLQVGQSGGNFLNLFGAIADTPVMMIRSLFNFDLFGVSALGIILSLLTGIILLGIIKKVWK